MSLFDIICTALISALLIGLGLFYFYMNRPRFPAQFSDTKKKTKKEWSDEWRIDRWRTVVKYYFEKMLDKS